MLIAKDRVGKRTIGFRSRRGESYSCPSCGKEVLPRKGSVRIHHFAHIAESACQYYSGEGELHREMKDFLFRYYARAPYTRTVEVEWPLDGAVADVYVEEKGGARIAIECQIARIEGSELMRRTVAYSRLGLYVLWILAGRRDLDEIVSRLKNSSAASLPYSADEIEKRLQQLYFGRFYYYFNGALFPVHMEMTEKWMNGSCEGCPRQFSCGDEERGRCEIYRPGFMGRMAKKQQVSVGMLKAYRPLSVERKGGLKLARLMDRRWWGTIV
ncbi:MAG: competence protein CoiA family protein [Candidatus Aureabacteria bacterium]|nr:competence protein CoiA family protein [Candidatus Auribacterota bacterium]